MQKGIGFLRMFADRNKAFAVLAIALETAQAVKQLAIRRTTATAEIAIATQVAMMRAMSDLGPIAGPPAAAAIAAKGAAAAAAVNAASAIGIGLTIAGGFVEAISALKADTGTDSATSSFGGNTFNEAGEVVGVAPSRAPTTIVQVNLGDTPVFSAEAVRRLIETMRLPRCMEAL